jgi:hypothetical protein
MSHNVWFDFYRCPCGFVWTIARKDDEELDGYQLARPIRSRVGSSL